MPSASDFLDGNLQGNKSASDFLDEPTEMTGVQPSNTSPMTLPAIAHRQIMNPTPFGGFGMAGPDTGQVAAQPYTDQEQALAKQGVDITSGAPWGLKNRLSLLVDPSDKDKIGAINSYFGKDVGASKTPFGFAYVDPETGRRTLVQSRADKPIDYVPTAGGSLDAIFGGGGGALGGLRTGAATGNPLAAAGGAILGAVGGQTIADMGKATINQFLGQQTIHSPDDVADTLKGVAKDAAVTGALTGAGELVGLTKPALKWFLTGFKDLSFSHAVNLQAGAAEATKGLDAWHELVGGLAQPDKGSLNLSVPELNPRDGLVRQFFDKAYKSSPELVAKEEERLNSNLDALGYTYGQYASALKPSADYRIGSSGYDMQQALASQKQTMLTQKQLDAQTQKDALSREATGLPSLSMTDMNARNKEMLDLLEQSGADAKDRAYGDLKVKLGMPASVAYDRTSDQWINSRTPDEVMGINPVTQTKMTNIWKDGMNLEKSPQGDGTKFFAAIPDNFYVNPSKPELGLKDLSNEKYDIFSTIDNIQDIRSGVRASMRARSGTLPPDAATSKHVADILEDNIGYHLVRKGDPSVLDAWDAAKQANINYNTNFKQGLLKQAMDTEGGFKSPVYTNATSTLLTTSGKFADQSGISRLGEILKGDPAATDQMRQQIWSLAKQPKYMPNGEFTQKSFSQFKDDFEGPINTFFSDDDRAKMNTFNDLTNSVARASQKVKQFNQAWKNSPEYGGIPMNSGALKDAVFNPRSVSPQVLDKMTTFLRSTNPTLLKEWQADTAAEFARRSSDANGVPIASKVTQMSTQLKDRLDQVMDPGYTYGLGTMSTAMTAAQGALNVQLDPSKPQSVLTQVVRAAVAPPMSSEGRWYSALLNHRAKAGGRVIYNALASPEGLNKFIATSKADASAAAGWGVVGDLGGHVLMPRNKQDTQDNQPN